MRVILTLLCLQSLRCGEKYFSLEGRLFEERERLENLSKEYKMSKLFISLLLLVIIAGCSTPTPTPTIPIPILSTMEMGTPTNTPICNFEYRTLEWQYQYRACANGFFVLYSTKQHPEPEPLELVVRVERASSQWQNLQVYENWVIFVYTVEEAKTALCKAVKDEGRTVAGDSILSDKDCP